VPPGHDAVEGREQGVNLALPAVKLLRDQQPVRYVVSAEREEVDTTTQIPFRLAAPQVARHARGSLVAILGVLGQQLHHDRRERLGDSLHPLAGRRRLPRDVTMDPLHRVGGSEGQRPRQHLVECDAAGVESASRLDRQVHAAGLLGRQVGQCPRDHLGRRGGLALAWQTGRDAEAGQPDRAGRDVNENVCRLDVFVDEASLVEPTQRGCQADGNAQERRYLPGLPLEPGHQFAALSLEQECRTSPVTHQLQGPSRPGGVQLVSELIRVLQPREAPRRGLRRRRGHCQERTRLALVYEPVQNELPVLPQRLRHVSRRFCHR
jgi:hypothetical protein